jgi:N-acyl-D-aspartate/D-glutamate deacylase
MALRLPTREEGEGTKMDDFLIRNIRIADGSGKDIYVGDVAWKDGIITAAGNAEGRDADIVIFDPETIGSEATLADSIKEPTGIEYVFVGGGMRLKKGKIL